MRKPPPRTFFETLFERHHRVENLHPDPLVFARGRTGPEEGELAGLLAASLAYGRVPKIMEALEDVFARLGADPREGLAASTPGELAERLRGFRYRFHTGPDLALFLHLVRQVLERWGTLREAFAAGDGGGDIAVPMTAFAEALFSGDARPLMEGRAVPPGHPVRHLLPSPVRGGAAKRFSLFLRWMVRRDEIDPGYWAGAFTPGRLVVPLDTHVAAVARELGLTRRRTSNWRTACEITAALRRYDPQDPVRFDFCLFRHGMGQGG